MTERLNFVDTHCHLHFDDYLPDVEQVIKDAVASKVTKMICVGVSLADSQKAIEFAAVHENVWATAGIHPHEAQNVVNLQGASLQVGEMLHNSKVVGVGEVGLDYFKDYSPRDKQIELLRVQIEAGLPSGLPFVFHVREAFEDFWKIIDSYNGIHGVIHSFSAHPDQLEQVLKRGFYVGLNGIMTFTKDPLQLEAAKKVPLDKLLLETDAPFLAPKPNRGKRCQPKDVVLTAEFLANLRGESLAELAGATTKNAVELFKL